MNEVDFDSFVEKLEQKLELTLPKAFWRSTLEDGVCYGSWSDERRRYYLFVKSGKVHCATGSTKRKDFDYDAVFNLDEWPEEFLDVTKNYFQVKYA